MKKQSTQTHSAPIIELARAAAKTTPLLSERQRAVVVNWFTEHLIVAYGYQGMPSYLKAIRDSGEDLLIVNLPQPRLIGNEKKALDEAIEFTFCQSTYLPYFDPNEALRLSREIRSELGVD